VSGFDQIDLDVVLNDSARTVVGVVSVTFDSDKIDSDTYHFRLYPNRLCDNETEDCSITVDSVFLDSHDVTESIVIDGTDLLVMTPDRLRTSHSRSRNIEIYFVTHLPEQRGRFGYWNGQYTLEAWFPMPAPWSDGAWLNVNYSENAEPVADHYDINVSLRLPDSLQVIAPGKKDSIVDKREKIISIILHPAQDVPVVIATGYEQHETDCNGTMIRTFFRSECAFASDTLTDVACRTISYMSDNVLPYPFEKIVLVIGGLSVGGGLELPRMVLLSSPESGLFTRVHQTTMVHEVVHQWFFGIVASDQAGEPWLDEAITEYFTEKINRWMVVDRADFFSHFGFVLNQVSVHRAVSRSINDLLPIDLPAQDYRRADYFRTVYGKGTLIMKTLTALMGSEKEKQFWQEYADSFRFRRPTRSDFVQLATAYLPTDDTSHTSDLISTITPLDFAIESITTVRENSPSDSITDSISGKEAYKITVMYTARQPLPFPVDFRIEYLDGSAFDTILYPTAGRHELILHHVARPTCAMIDAWYKYAIDGNYLNNSLQLSGGEGSGPRLFSGVLFLVESLFSMLWGL